MRERQNNNIIKANIESVLTKKKKKYRKIEIIWKSGEWMGTPAKSKSLESKTSKALG